MDYLCIIGINLGKNKEKSASHDKLTMYRLSYVNSHVILEKYVQVSINNYDKSQLVVYPPLRNWSFIVGMFGYFPFGSLVTIYIW